MKNTKTVYSRHLLSGGECQHCFYKHDPLKTTWNQTLRLRFHCRAAAQDHDIFTLYIYIYIVLKEIAGMWGRHCALCYSSVTWWGSHVPPTATECSSWVTSSSVVTWGSIHLVYRSDVERQSSVDTDSPRLQRSIVTPQLCTYCVEHYW